MLKKYMADPAIIKDVNANTVHRNAMALVGAETLAVTDNSTGSTTAYAEVKPQRTRFAHVTGSDLAQKSAFDTAHGVANNGIKVLAGLINSLGAPAGLVEITGGDGTVATPGTIPAMTKTVTGTDGSTAAAQPRANANQAFITLRDNMATLVLALNRVRAGYSLAPLAITGEGKASSTLVLANKTAAGEAVDNTGDALSKAHADAQFTAHANAVAWLGAKIAATREAALALVPAVAPFEEGGE